MKISELKKLNEATLGGFPVKVLHIQDQGVDEASPMIKPPTNRFDSKQEAFAYVKQHGGKVFKSTYTDPNTGMKTTTFVVKKDVEEGVVADLAYNAGYGLGKVFGRGVAGYRAGSTVPTPASTPATTSRPPRPGSRPAAQATDKFKSKRTAAASSAWKEIRQNELFDRIRQAAKNKGITIVDLVPNDDGTISYTGTNATGQTVKGKTRAPVAKSTTTPTTPQPTQTRQQKQAAATARVRGELGIHEQGVEEGGILGFMAQKNSKAKTPTSLSTMRKEFEKEKTAKLPGYTQTKDLPKNPQHVKTIRVAEDNEKDLIAGPVMAFYRPVIQNAPAGKVDDYVEKAKDLLKQTDDPRVRRKLIDILKQGQHDMAVQGGILTAVAAVVGGGLMSVASNAHLTPHQTNLLMQAVLNTIVPTMAARMAGKNWKQTLKYTLGSLGVGVGVAGAMGEGKSGDKYKVKSIGHDARGDYYISPSTGKKVYKSGVNRGDHEVPGTGEIKKKVAEAIKLDAPQRTIPRDELQGYADRIKTGTKTKRDKFSPIIHGSNIKAITKDDANTEWDLDDLARQITTRPKAILGTNAKMEKSKTEGEIVYDLTLPALSGIVVDEDTGDFVEITTCPGAGACQLFCYARKGGYVMFPASSMSAAQALNFLVNDPEGYSARVNQEIKTVKAKADKAGIRLVVRWHDAGDFFSKEYLDLAYDVAKSNPDVQFYAYTKMGDVATGATPANFTMNFSSGSKRGEEKKVEFHKSQGNVVKQGVTVPKDMFFDLIARKGNSLIKDAKGRTQFASPEALDTFKQRLAQKYQVAPDSIITYDQMLATPVGTEPKWNVIVQPGAGDRAANRKDVIDSYLMFH